MVGEEHLPVGGSSATKALELHLLLTFGKEGGILGIVGHEKEDQNPHDDCGTLSVWNLM
jgi:hypothetical protein